MTNDMTLEIKDIGPINKAEIKLDKITIVGGMNGSGKSTVSKLLYCFLRASEEDKHDFFLEKVHRKIDDFIWMFRFSSDKESKLSKELYRLRKKPGRGFFNENLTFEDISDYFNDVKKVYQSYLSEEELKILEEFTKPKNIIERLYQGQMDLETFGVSNDSSSINRFLAKFIGVASWYYLLSNDSEHRRNAIIKTLLIQELDIPVMRFSKDNSKNNLKTTKYLKLYDDVCCYDMDLDNSDLNIKEELKIHNVHFIDPVSYYYEEFTNLPKISLSDHYKYLKSNLKNSSGTNETIPKESKEILSKLEDLIGGKIVYTDKFIFKSENRQFPMKNTASGVKQLAFIYNLLSNNRLGPGDVLLFDEPEVNLHPEWQIKFAEILILIAKELDVKIYVNSHSPMFIEAMVVYSEYYYLLDETNVYLTERVVDNKFNFRKIRSKDMGAIYENLTRPFDDLDFIKSEISKRS